MSRPLENPYLGWATALFMLVAVFIIDLNVQLGVTVGIGYVLVAGLQMGSRQRMLSVAAISTPLVILGSILSPDGTSPWMAHLNRALTIGILWVLVLILDREVRRASVIRTRETQSRLREVALAERRLRLALDAANVGLWDWNVAEDTVYFSPQLKKQLGHDPEESWIDYMDWESRLHPEDREAAVQLVQNYFAGKVSVYESRFRLRHKDGSYRWILSQGDVLRDPNEQVERMMGVHIDVTDLKEMEEALSRHAAELQRSNDALQQFAYVASHDLRAPLRNIDALASWVQEDADDRLPSECRAHLQSLRQRVKLMDRLLNDLLQFSRVGRKESSPEWVDVKELVEEVSVLIGPPKGFRIEITGVLPKVLAPRTALRKVFQNLIENGIKHHHQDSGGVNVSGRVLADCVEYTITDDGPGIAPEYHETIFGIFQTLKRRDDHDSSGMGLAIVRKTIETYGGTIRVSSRPGEGTSFHFTWPSAQTRGS